MGMSAEAVGLALAWVVAVAGGGAVVTDLGRWYRQLHKPSWQPPDWLFGPVWTVIFLLSGLAAVLAWGSSAVTPAARRAIAVTYVLNGLLNVGWSLLFFRLHRPDWALLEVVPLWLSIVAMALTVRPLSSAGVVLLLPYLAWVAFAAVLNLTIVRLNPGSPDL